MAESDADIINRWDLWLEQWRHVNKGGYPGLAHGDDSKPDGDHNIAAVVESCMCMLREHNRTLYDVLMQYYMYTDWWEETTGAQALGVWIRKLDWGRRMGMTDEERAYRALDRARLKLESLLTNPPI